MKCPHCLQTDFFRVQAWEVTTYTAYLNNIDIEESKYNDTRYVAIEPNSYAYCMDCEHEAPLEDFGPEFPFPLLECPDFEQKAKNDKMDSESAKVMLDLAQSHSEGGDK